MKIISLFSGALLIAVHVTAAERGAKFPPPPPPVVVAPPAPAPTTPAYIYDQKPMGGRAYLVSPEQAQAAINKFKEVHARPGASQPRIVIFVNRELIDERSGLKLSARSEQVETTRQRAEGGAAGNSSEAAKHKNTYRIHDRAELSLADRQTMRDIERLFGRPLRLGGASIVDQRIAVQMLGGRTLDNLATMPESEQARREREAISKIADIALEVLVSSRQVVVPGISGDTTATIPDLQATAIRLSDSKVLGQATAADLLGRAGSRVRQYDVREISEATALALMEDMTLQ